MTMYSYSQNRHSDPADASSDLALRLNDLQVRSARAQAARLHHSKGKDQCVDCNEPIGPKRKEAVPSATRCAPCQQDHDHEALLSSRGGQPD